MCSRVSPTLVNSHHLSPTPPVLPVRASGLNHRTSFLFKAPDLCVDHLFMGCAAGGYAFGDCLTQQLGPLWPTAEWPSKHNLAKHDLNKTGLMAAVGGAVGAPVSVALYAWMDTISPGTGMAVMAAKFAVDQVVGCVLWQAAYMCISEPYRRTFSQFAADKWQQQQQQRNHRQHGCGAAIPARGTGVGPAVAAC